MMLLSSLTFTVLKVLNNYQTIKYHQNIKYHLSFSLIQAMFFRNSHSCTHSPLEASQCNHKLILCRQGVKSFVQGHLGGGNEGRGQSFSFPFPQMYHYLAGGLQSQAV